MDHPDIPYDMWGFGHSTGWLQPQPEINASGRNLGATNILGRDYVLQALLERKGYIQPSPSYVRPSIPYNNLSRQPCENSRGHDSGNFDSDDSFGNARHDSFGFNFLHVQGNPIRTGEYEEDLGVAMVGSNSFQGQEQGNIQDTLRVDDRVKDNEWDSESESEYTGPPCDSTGTKDGKNPLFKGLVANKHGLFFSSAEQCTQLFKNKPLWRPKDELLPDTEDDRAPYVICLRDAIMHLDKQLDQADDSAPDQAGEDASLTRPGESFPGDVSNSSFTQTVQVPSAQFPPTEVIKGKVGKQKGGRSMGSAKGGPVGGTDRWEENATYYEAFAIEGAAQMLLAKVIDLHKNGWTRANLEPKQLGMKNLYEPKLRFKARIDAIEEVLMHNKSMCKNLLDGNDLMIDKLVGGPHKYSSRSNGLKTLNAGRQAHLERGREAKAQSIAAEEAPQQQEGTTGRNKPKRKAIAMSAEEEERPGGRVNQSARDNRPTKKPRLAKTTEKRSVDVGRSLLSASPSRVKSPTTTAFRRSTTAAVQKKKDHTFPSNHSPTMTTPATSTTVSRSVRSSKGREEAEK
ncbi:uncharacterized protein BDZ99DRAFT_515287 [Mytilinidion resinicola]|uniref:Uncharacterized protein n=1 Tax=Mytilinidion resinicola TaxID=574789 RepID=A0A6A6Z7L4_9PEZI|nr:uncharacterized protein BDZ99DRAFT_515287 [Mytilinidion resinicola]KAF2816709.1 hypothetical protein BDZ99DRAFT_515287 [Mytilinidion resinicola]